MEHNQNDERGSSSTTKICASVTAVVQEMEKVNPDTPNFSGLFSYIEHALKAIHVKLAKFKLSPNVVPVEKVGAVVSGIFVGILGTSSHCHQLYIKNKEQLTVIEAQPQGDYVVCFNGIDSGDENLTCGWPVGTIFSIYKKPQVGMKRSLGFLAVQNLLTSGYVVHASTTHLVLTLNKTVFTFILDEVIGDFILLDNQVKIPFKGKIFSANEGKSGLWEPQIIEFIRRKKDPKVGKPMRAKFTGSVASDFHTVLYQGGIFMIPSDRINPQGSMTLLCESIPLAFIIDAAGGCATSGKLPILEIVVETVEQKTPLFLGSPVDVNELLLSTKPPVVD